MARMLLQQLFCARKSGKEDKMSPTLQKESTEMGTDRRT